MQIRDTFLFIWTNFQKYRTESLSAFYTTGFKLFNIYMPPKGIIIYSIESQCCLLINLKRNKLLRIFPLRIYNFYFTFLGTIIYIYIYPCIGDEGCQMILDSLVFPSALQFIKQNKVSIKINLQIFLNLVTFLSILDTIQFHFNQTHLYVKS